ncbi:hypothetical protein N5079_17290 [Planotetraspora sp. A-T 1434]|uniref:hypothetical protein n=1 Tax=Planotetraspora sp. A-T 1434 TaxID=2979219 RepID=UPI0021BFA4F5|nr:hypothetical protein [Planotetraspora sp. A-T 1434]MCT9931959.1 hypothetical protein [Planotetraspora sp. A-T 1434]
MSKRNLAGTMILAGLALTLVGCTDERPPSIQDEARRRDAALVAIVQCFIDRGAISAAEVKSQPWLQNGKVQPSAELLTWANGHEETVYRGKTLIGWEDDATAVWPNWKCPL